jgi:thiol-disulfide isomerase/thioredoxin
MKRENIIISIITFFTLIFFFTLISFNAKLNILRNELTEVKEELEYKDLEVAYSERQKNENIISAFSYLSIDGLKMSDIKTNKIELLLSESEKICIKRSNVEHLTEIVDRPTVVFRFFSSNCGSCITTQLEILNKFSKKFGKKKVILLPDHLNNQIRDYLIKEKIIIGIYETDDVNLGFDFDKQKIPYLFLCNKDMDINISFILDNNLKEYSDFFFSAVLNRIE